MMMKTYDECVSFPTFLERYRYLALHGIVGEETFGYSRYLNQELYSCSEWRNLRWKIIDRDKARDLACEGYDIFGSGRIVIHHINPITLKDIHDRNPLIFDEQNLICVSVGTHKAIHYGDESKLPLTITDRKPGDTCPWK